MQKITLANGIVIRWNPVTDNGSVRLNLFDFALDANGGVTGFLDPDNVDVAEEDISSIALRVAQVGTFTDPVTGNALPTEVSGAAVMFLIKRLVDEVIESRKLLRLQSTMYVADSYDGLNATVSLANMPEEETFVSGVADFGDGSTPVELDQQMTATHTYTSSGTYTIKLTVNLGNYQGVEVLTHVDL